MGRAEAYVEDYLVKRANELGFYCCKFTSPATNGVPDRILIGYGRTFFVETKAPGGKPRPLQRAVHKQMRAHGGEVYVASTREQVDDILLSIIDQNRSSDTTKGTSDA